MAVSQRAELKRGSLGVASLWAAKWGCTGLNGGAGGYASRFGEPDKQNVLGLLLLFIRGPLSLGYDVDFSTSVVFSWLNIRWARRGFWLFEGSQGA